MGLVKNELTTSSENLAIEINRIDEADLDSMSAADLKAIIKKSHKTMTAVKTSVDDSNDWVKSVE